MDKKDFKKSVQAIARRVIPSLLYNYSTVNRPDSNTLLLQGIYSKPRDRGVNKANLWGDYFYLEALMRLVKFDGSPTGNIVSVERSPYCAQSAVLRDDMLRVPF